MLILILIWYISATAIDSRILLPTPYDVLNKMAEVFSLSSFYDSLSGTLLRTLLSFLIALVAAVGFALLANLSVIFEKLFYPIVVLVRATPTMSVIFICLIWFPSKISPMIVATAVIFPAMYSSVFAAVKSCDKRLLEMSLIYAVPVKTRIAKLYLPYVFNKVYADAVSCISLNVKLIVAAEALAQTNISLGVSMQIAKANLETATLFAYTVAAVVLSFLLELFLKLIHYILRRIRDAKTD